MSYNHEDFKKKLRDTLDDIFELVAAKNLAYGNSYEVVPQIMKILYPNGVSPEQMDNMLLIVRVMDKIKRIVEDNDPFGEDPWSDVLGYSLLKVTTRPKPPAPESPPKSPILRDPRGRTAPLTSPSPISSDL